MRKVLLARHGDIAADMARYRGCTDVPLSERGVRQAELLSRRLDGEEIGAVYSSDLRRTMATAAIIAESHGVPLVASPELREIDFGRCEGLTFDEMMERHPETRGIWTADGQDICFPGGESVAAMAKRVSTFAGRLHCGPYGTALVVAHGGSLRILVCLLAGFDLSAWRDMRIERASLSIIEIDNHQGVLRILNDVSHLRECAGNESEQHTE